MGTAPVDFVPDGFVDGWACPAEDIAGYGAGSGVGEGVQTGLMSVLTCIAAWSSAGGRGSRPPAADLPPERSGAGSTGRSNPPVMKPAGDGGSSDDGGGLAGRALDLEDDANGREGGPRRESLASLA